MRRGWGSGVSTTNPQSFPEGCRGFALNNEGSLGRWTGSGTDPGEGGGWRGDRDGGGPWKTLFLRGGGEGGGR